MALSNLERKCSNSLIETGKQSVPIRGATDEPGRDAGRSYMRLFVGIRVAANWSQTRGAIR
jgi:hypothetical protein